LNPLKAQDRIIRLEERLRYQQVLSPALLPQTSALRMGQITALRFAGDDELEELVSAVLAGKLTKSIEIKRAIKNWRADTFRV
jgi:transcription elongation GreA/GreB family factor